MEGPDLTGRTVGNWRLVALLGEGAFGAVYDAENTFVVGKRAAVKILHPHLGANDNIKQRFLNEADAASRADHPNIVQVMDGGITEGGLCYSVMERLVGRTLTAALREGAMAPARAIVVCRQIAEALASAHARKIVHRDLKPDNVFLVEKPGAAEFVKVLDFGVAKLRGDGTPGTITATGVLLGTPGYMSPEQRQSMPDVDGRADVYALGIVLYQCLTGALPFLADTPYGWLRAHMETPPPDPGALVAIPVELRRLVQRMLAKKREERPAMDEAVRLLDGVARQVVHAPSLPASPLPPPSPPPPQPPTRITPPPTDVAPQALGATVPSEAAAPASPIPSRGPMDPRAIPRLPLRPLAPPSVPTRGRGLAITAVVLGALFFVPGLFVVAAILGVVVLVRQPRGSSVLLPTLALVLAGASMILQIGVGMVALTSMQGYMGNARLQEGRVNLRTLAREIEMYHVEQGKLPADGDWTPPGDACALGGRFPDDRSVWQAAPWTDLHFAPEGRSVFQYRIQQDGAGTDVVEARADPRCEGRWKVLRLRVGDGGNGINIEEQTVTR